MQPGGRDERYYIQFQVWRPTGVPGCYTMVGFNAPPEPTLDGMGEVNNTNQLLQPGDPLDHCVHLPVSEGEQIEFQPGDVIGYYADRFRERNGRDPETRLAVYVYVAGAWDGHMHNCVRVVCALRCVVRYPHFGSVRTY